MLEVIKETINNCTNDEFDVYYQKYIMQQQDSIIDKEIRSIYSSCGYNSINDLCESIGVLVEELSNYEK